LDSHFLLLPINLLGSFKGFAGRDFPLTHILLRRRKPWLKNLGGRGLQHLLLWGIQRFSFPGELLGGSKRVLVARNILLIELGFQVGVSTELLVAQDILSLYDETIAQRLTSLTHLLAASAVGRELVLVSLVPLGGSDVFRGNWSFLEVEGEATLLGLLGVLALTPLEANRVVRLVGFFE